MKRTKVLFLGSYASQIAYDSTFDLHKRTGQQLQKFGRLLTEGLCQNNIDVEVLCKMPVNRQNYDRIFFFRKKELINGIRYKYHFIINIPILKSFFLVPSIILFLTSRLIFSKKTVVFCDPMNTMHFYVSKIVTFILRRKLVALVTDVPLHYVGYLDRKIPFSMRFTSKIMSSANGYILITKQMSDLVNPRNRPFVIVEGFSDFRLINKNNNLLDKKKPYVCMYAGGIVKEYGLENLIEAFIKCGMEDWELHIYGGGKFSDELSDICSIYKSIKYFGVKDNSYIIEKEYEATILINPRISDFDYTKYSFPSKNIEYMSTGTPLLTTNLPGMPKEYLGYVYLFLGESVDEMTMTLNKTLRIPQNQLHEFGLNAKKWIQEEKNNIIQAQKIKLLITELLNSRRGEHHQE